VNYETCKVTLVMTNVEFEAVHTALETYVRRNRSDETQEQWVDKCSTIRSLNFTFSEE